MAQKVKWAPNAVLVSGLDPDPESATVNITEALRTHFESNDNSGGGPIEEDGIQFTNSKAEALLLFVNEKDATSVRQKRNHIVNFNGTELNLEILKCPLKLYIKYFKEHDSSSESSTESFVVLDKTLNEVDESQMETDNSNDDVARGNQDSYVADMENEGVDNKNNNTTDINQPQSMPEIPEVYLSVTVLEIQKKEEEKWSRLRREELGLSEMEEQREGDNDNALITPSSENRRSSIEKAQYESTEKEKLCKGTGDGPSITSQDDHISEERPKVQSADEDCSFNEPAKKVIKKEVENTNKNQISPKSRNNSDDITKADEKKPRDCTRRDNEESNVNNVKHSQVKTESIDNDLSKSHVEKQNQKLPEEQSQTQSNQSKDKSGFSKETNMDYTLPKPLKDNAPQNNSEQPSATAVDDVAARTVILKGITPEVNLDFVEVYFESERRSGGGPLESMEFLEHSQTAALVFEKKQHAENILSKEEYTIEGHTIKVMPPNKPDEASSDNGASSDEKTDGPVKIKVTGLKKGASKEMLMLFFEHKRKCNGGEIESFEVDSLNGTAVLIYEDTEVAERVLAQKKVTFSGNEMTLMRMVTQEWDKKTVYVTGFDNMSEESLELLYENTRKSGGGPVEAVVMDKDGRGALVTFEKEKDAAQVLHQGIVKRRDGTIIKSTKPPTGLGEQGNTTEEEEIVVSRSITVLGLDENVTEDLLEMLFENEGRSGGGPIEFITIDAEFGIAVVTFKDYRVAQRVLARETISFQNLSLIIQPHSGENVPTTKDKEPQGAACGSTSDSTEESATTSTAQNQRNRGSFNCIEVIGLTQETSSDFVHLFFESHKSSGGGDIEKISHNQEQGTAMITFKDESTTKSVLTKHNESPLSIDGSELQIRPIDTSLYNGGMPAFTSCAVEVTGLPVNASEETLLMFFENRRMSGGANIEEIVHTAVEGRAVITYENTEVAQRVLEMHKSKPLHIESTMLQVRMVCSNSRPSQVIGPKEADTLFIKNLPDAADAEDVRLYLERVPQCKVQECIFGTTAGTVLVYFVFAPGYERFFELSCQKPLRGHMIDIESVSRSKSIEVFGSAGFSSQKLRLYFEHTRSKGGDVEKVDLLNEDDCAIVTFVKYGVAEKVLTKPDHKLENKQLIVKLHHACIGILPPNHDHTSPSAGIPHHATIKQVDPDILGFVMTTPTNRQFMEENLKSVHGEVEWPEGLNADVEINVKCTLERSIPDLQRKVMTWEQDIEAIFREIMTNFIKDKVNVLQEGWQEFLRISGDLKPQNSEDVQVEVDHNTCTVSALGKKDTVEQMMESFRQALGSIEDKLNRQKQIISEPVTNLKPYQIKFLLAHKFPQNIKQMFQDMKFDADMKQCKVVFNGIPSDIITAKLQMYELVSEMRYEKLHLSKPVCMLIKQKKTRDYLVSQFQERDCVIVTDVLNDSEVMVYAKTQEELTSGVAVIRSEIKDNRITVSEESKAVLRTDKWKLLHDTQLREKDGELKILLSDDLSSIQVIATQQITDGILEIIKNFLNENTILENFEHTEKGRATLVIRENQMELGRIEQDFKGYSVSIDRSSSDANPGLMVRGTKDGLPMAVLRVKKLLEDVVCLEHQINKPGMPKYFHEERGKNVLHSMENRYRVAIVSGDKDTPQVEDFSSMAAAAFPTSTGPKTKSKVSLDRGRTIHIVRGDLTAYRVDVIVNAANERMEHIGGLAKAIVDKGGLSIQRECSKFINVEGRLLTGQVYTSDAGNLPCRKIIHTVGPRWQGGYRNEENELFEAVYASLLEASALQFHTIALPAVSSGVYGFPKRKCCTTIFEAIKEYVEKERSSLTEIHLVDNNMDLVNTFHESAETVFGRDKVEDLDKPTVTTSSRFQAPQTTSSSSTASSSTAYWTKNGNNLTSKEGITVKLIKGSIVSQQADVVINTTNAELNLASGGVSALILQAAGPGIQQECQAMIISLLGGRGFVPLKCLSVVRRIGVDVGVLIRNGYIESTISPFVSSCGLIRKAPGGVKAGQLVQTSGGNTNWKAIYHGSCPNYNGAQTLQILKQFVNTCLTTAHSSGYTSIALPAIGTGNLKYPRNEVAQAMYEEVKNFSQNTNGTSLTDVQFVVFDKDTATVKAFEAEADRLKSTTSSTQKTTYRSNRKLARGNTFTSRENMAELHEESDGATASSSAREHISLLQPGDIAQLHTEHLSITLVKGDITQQTTAAIVNSTSKELNFGSMVSRAILKAGGGEIARECAAIGSTDKEHLAVTKGGDLNCNYIIHVAAPWDNMGYIRKWKQRIGNILKKADGLWCQSISFPALGTGTLSTDPSKMAGAMFEAFHEFGKTANNLKEIRVVVYEDKMINTFQKQLEKMGQKKKGFVEIISDAVQALGHYFSSTDNSIEEAPYEEGHSGAYRQRKTSAGQFGHRGEIDPSIMTFNIYGFSETKCSEVARAIDNTCDEEMQDKILDSESDKEIINKLTAEQVQLMKSWEHIHHIKITIDKGQRVSRIRIQGQHQNVLDVLEKVYKLFREVDQSERDKNEAEYIAKQVQWQYDDGSSLYQPYPPEMNALIEKAYLNKENYVEFTEEDDEGQQKTVKVTFSTMEETDPATQNKVPVRRYTPESVELPSNWTPMTKNQPFTLVDLTAGSADYTSVENQFSTSFQQGGSGYNSIIKIQRLQNPSMYKKYQVHKIHMEVANPKTTTNEKILWHGTSDDTLEEIHTNGFNRSFCGKNGTAYGRGVYFATYTTLSSGYAKPNAAGHKHMYMCRVLTGEFTTGNSSLLVPPPKDPQKPSIKFDSVVDNTTTTKIYVVFQDTQAYPEYLITFN